MSESNYAIGYMAVAVVIGSAMVSATLLWCSYDVESELHGIHSDLYSIEHSMEDIDRSLRGFSHDITSSLEKPVTVKVIPQPNPADKKAELERLLVKVKTSHDEIEAILNSPVFVEDREKLILEERRKIKEAMDRLEEREKME